VPRSPRPRREPHLPLRHLPPARPLQRPRRPASAV